MKKLICILTVVMIALTSVSLTSCKKDKAQMADKQLTEAVKGLTFPQLLNDGSKLTACYYSNKILTFRCELDKDKFEKVKSEDYREKTLQRLKTGLFPRNLIKNVVQADASLEFIYTDGTDSITYSYTPEELKLLQ